MKKYFQYVVFIGFLAVFGCQKDPIPKDIPECLKKIISDIESQKKWNPPAKIFRYKFDGQIVYLIPQRCCDIPSVVIDENCNPICSSGGISGSTDEKCMDFFNTRTDEQLIWQDTR